MWLKSPRIVPMSASPGYVEPTIFLTVAIALEPWITIAMTGVEVTKSIK